MKVPRLLIEYAEGTQSVVMPLPVRHANAPLAYEADALPARIAWNIAATLTCDARADASRIVDSDESHGERRPCPACRGTACRHVEEIMIDEPCEADGCEEGWVTA